MKRPFTELDCSSCFIAFLSLTQAIPLQEINGPLFGASVSVNVTNEENVCIHESRIYREGENLSTSNPCETCVCDPPGFSCSLIRCDLKPGCKAIHKANRCCPDYVCECERNGKIYGNGEKVEEPNPCKVCYCKGGEIKCALVTCYTRDDCEPGYVAGVCCPKYDHCPPLDTLKNKSTTPAPVIISDLKTESAPTTVTYKMADDRDVVSPVAPTPEPTTTEDEGSAFMSTEMFDAELTNATDSEMLEIVDVDRNETDAFGLYDPEANVTTTESDTFVTLSEESEQTTTENSTTFESIDVETTTEGFTTSSAWNRDEVENVTETIDFRTEYVTGALDSSETTSDTPATIEEVTTMKATDVPTTITMEATTVLTFNESMATEETTTAVAVTTTAFDDLILDDGNDTSTPATTTEAPDLNPMTDEDRSMEDSQRSIVKVIVPKAVKKDVDQVQRAADGPAPIVVMISADQIQFLKLAEEPPVYVDSGDSVGGKVGGSGHLGVVVVPKTTPTTVEMVKVMDPPKRDQSSTMATYEETMGSEPHGNASVMYTNSRDTLQKR